MKQIVAYESTDGLLFRTKDECTDHEYNLKLNNNSNLTMAEQKVCDLLFTQPTLSDIAKILDIRLVTVKKHCSQIYQKLNVKNKSELLQKSLTYS